jgi:hypothetical protein
MIIAGYILAFVGVVVCLVGEVMLLVVSYKRGFGWFFGCMFFPPLWLGLLAFHFRETIKPLAITLGGIVMAYVGATMAGIEV